MAFVLVAGCAAGPEDVTLAVAAEHFEAVDVIDEDLGLEAHLGERAGCSPTDAPQAAIVTPHVMCPHEGAQQLDDADGAFVMRR